MSCENDPGLATTLSRLLFLGSDVAKVGCLFHLNGHPISQRKVNVVTPPDGVSTSLLHPPSPALQPPIALPSSNLVFSWAFG
jgi:hypothetical protein